MHQINRKRPKHLFKHLRQRLIIKDREILRLTDMEFQRNLLCFRVCRHPQAVQIPGSYKNIVLLPQRRHQIPHMELRPPDIIKCLRLKIQMKKIKDIFMSVKQFAVHLNIVANLLVRVFHAIEVVLPHLHRVTLLQNGIMGVAQRLLFRRIKRSRALVIDKGIIAHHMAVTHLLTAVAEIIFLPITPPERFRIKQPHFLNHLPLDIHTEAHRHRNPRITAQAAPLNQRRIFVNRHIFRHRVVPAEDRHGTERRTIRERRYGSVPPGQVGARLNLLHPAFRDNGIRI